MTTVTQKIPSGYKQTEIGVIPADWDVVTYGQAFDFLRTAQYSRKQLNNNGQTVISITEIFIQGGIILWT